MLWQSPSLTGFFVCLYYLTFIGAGVCDPFAISIALVGLGGMTLAASVTGVSSAWYSSCTRWGGGIRAKGVRSKSDQTKYQMVMGGQIRLKTNQIIIKERLNDIHMFLESAKNVFPLWKNHNKSPKMGQVKKWEVLDALDGTICTYCHSSSTIIRVYGQHNTSHSGKQRIFNWAE